MRRALVIVFSILLISCTSPIPQNKTLSASYGKKIFDDTPSQILSFDSPIVRGLDYINYRNSDFFLTAGWDGIRLLTNYTGEWKAIKATYDLPFSNRGMLPITGTSFAEEIEGVTIVTTVFNKDYRESLPRCVDKGFYCGDFLNTFLDTPLEKFLEYSILHEPISGSLDYLPTRAFNFNVRSDKNLLLITGYSFGKRRKNISLYAYKNYDWHLIYEEDIDARKAYGDVKYFKDGYYYFLLGIENSQLIKVKLFRINPLTFKVEKLDEVTVEGKLNNVKISGDYFMILSDSIYFYRYPTFNFYNSQMGSFTDVEVVEGDMAVGVNKNYWKVFYLIRNQGIQLVEHTNQRYSEVYLVLVDMNNDDKKDLVVLEDGSGKLLVYNRL